MKKIIFSAILGFLFLTSCLFGQVRIDSAQLNIVANPPTVRVKLTTTDLNLNRIMITSLNDSNNTQVVEIFYKSHPNCASIFLQRNWDTTYQFNAIYPFDLKIYGIWDTFLLCTPFPTSPLYLDSFIMKAGQIMPVKFTGINGQSVGSKGIIQWSVAKESNLYKYVVQKADLRQVFVDVATVLPSGVNNYKWIDAVLLQGQNFYRIKAIDKDGSTKYSNVVSIKNVTSGNLSVYPNPSKNYIFINSSNMTSYWLFDEIGRIVFSKKIKSNNDILFLNGFPNGVYLLKVQSSGGTQHTKIIVR